MNADCVLGKGWNPSKPAFPFSNSRTDLTLTSDANIHAGSSVNTAFRR